MRLHQNTATPHIKATTTPFSSHPIFSIPINVVTANRRPVFCYKLVPTENKPIALEHSMLALLSHSVVVYIL